MRKPKRNPLTAPLRAIAAFGALCCSAAPQPAWGADPVSETPPIETHGSHEPIEEIVVTASPLGRDEAGTTTAVNVLTREHLLTHGGSTLGEILANEPGIATSGFSPGASRPVTLTHRSNRALFPSTSAPRTGSGIWTATLFGDSTTWR